MVLGMWKQQAKLFDLSMLFGYNKIKHDLKKEKGRKIIYETWLSIMLSA